VYFQYLGCICNLNCILNICWQLACICILNFAYFTIVSRNTLQKVNLMRSLMANWYRWLYSSGWRNNRRSIIVPSGSCRMNIPDAIFRLTEQYPLPKSVLCSNVLSTSCDIVTLRCTGLVLVVHDRLLWSPYVIGRPYIFSSCSFFPSSSFFFFLA